MAAVRTFDVNPSTGTVGETLGVAAGMTRVSSWDISDRLLCIEYGIEESCVLCEVSLDPDGPSSRLEVDDVAGYGDWGEDAGED